MAYNNFMDKIRTYFGIRQEPPRNEFRNPIWGNDDEDDDDELYARQYLDVYREQADLREFSRHMQEMFQSFGSMFEDMRSFFREGQMDSFTITEPQEPQNFNSKSIRDYYLNPGYHHKHDEHKEDSDLDGKISSNDISGLLKQNEDSVTPFNGNLVPGKSFCRTIITTSVTKPDGTMETRRIVKNGNEVIEETVTTTESSQQGPFNSPIDPVTNLMLSKLSSIFKNFY